MDSPDMARALSLIQDFASTPDLEDIGPYIGYFQQYATGSFPNLSEDRKLNASLLWLLAARRRQHESLLSAYCHLADCLAHLPALGLDMWTRKQLLDRLPEDLATSAARQAIMSGDLELAIDLLDKCRGLTWGQLLRTLPPDDEIERLVNSHPKLGVPLRGYLRALHISSMSHRARSLHADQRLTQAEIDDHVEMAKGVEDILGRDRELPEFEDFLLPNPLRDARKLAGQGAVVILVPDDTCTHILLLRDSFAAPEHHICEELDLEKARNMAQAMELVLSRCGLSARGDAATTEVREDAEIEEVGTPDDPTERGFVAAGGRRRTRSRPVDDELGDILSSLWRTIGTLIRDVLSLEPNQKDPPKVYLYPAGPLASLPIHASGVYLSSGSEALLDYLVPSYIPIFQHLSFLPPAVISRPPHVLVISQPDTPNQNPLPATKIEVAEIKKYVPPDRLSVAEGTQGNKQALISTAWVLSRDQPLVLHLACHARQDPSDPFTSAFLLHDGPTLMSQLLGQRSHQPLLAVLSACQTAAGDEVRPDEALSIGAAMHCFTGFPSVIATMWAIQDEDGPTMTSVLYRELFSGGMTRISSAAALRTAVNGMRARVIPLVRWVPFMHFGI